MDTNQAQALVAAGATQTKHDRPCLNVPVWYPFSQTLLTGETRLDLQQTVDSDADFYLRGWKWLDLEDAGHLILARFRLLNGYYLSNALMPMVQADLRSITPELKIPAGGFIGIEATNLDASSHKMKVIFFGVKRFYLDAVKAA
jgi:hypothetical protein